MQTKTVAFTKDASNLFFHILTRCNLSCTHCYINEAQHGKNTLDIETIRAWLDLFSKKAPQTNLILLGGEPTLHKDLHLVVKHANQLKFKSITIDTNGYLFHDILNKITSDQLNFLSFSLDGATPETNDAIRGNGCFQKVLNSIKEAVSKGFSCSMIYTVSDKNIHELDQMPDLVKNLGIKLFYIQVVGIRGASSKADTPRQVSKEAWLTTIPKVAEAMASHGIVVMYPKVFLHSNESFQCAGNVANNYFVFPNGRVYQCPICEDYPLHSFEIIENQLIPRPKLNEKDLFALKIDEGCVMNKLIQPQNLSYSQNGKPDHQIACCLLKEVTSK